MSRSPTAPSATTGTTPTTIALHPVETSREIALMRVAALARPTQSAFSIYGEASMQKNAF